MRYDLSGGARPRAPARVYLACVSVCIRVAPFLARSSASSPLSSSPPSRLAACEWWRHSYARRCACLSAGGYRLLRHHRPLPWFALGLPAPLPVSPRFGATRLLVSAWPSAPCVPLCRSVFSPRCFLCVLRTRTVSVPTCHLAAASISWPLVEVFVRSRLILASASLYCPFRPAPGLGPSGCDWSVLLNAWWHVGLLHCCIPLLATRL